jgi:hypothetical protein
MTTQREPSSMNYNFKYLLLIAFAIGSLIVGFYNLNRGTSATNALIDSYDELIQLKTG